MESGRSIEGSFDLHIHSVFSDGSQTVADLIDEARGRGLARIAVTDHDSLRQLSRVRTAAREAGFPVLAGVEASCFDPHTGRKIHILAYGLEATPEGDGPLEKIMDETLARRVANTLWQAWTLERAHATFDGRALHVRDVIETAGESTGVYKQHVMQALTGLDYNDAVYQREYRSLFKGDGIAVRDITYPDAVSVVRAVREQGGVPVLAHPQQMDSWGAVPELIRAGLRGIEAFHPDNDAAASARCFELAREYGLFCTGGSDYHGRYGAPEHVGACFITPDEAASCGETVENLFRREAELN